MSAPSPVEVSRNPGVSPSSRWLLGCICAATFVLYLGTAWFGFVLDDAYQVLDTAAIHSWKYFLGYFTSATFATPYYRPLLLIWFRINDALFGAHASGWHMAEVALHVLVSALVYALARRLGATSRVALAAALIFGVHPVHIQNAAYVSDACDPLCTIFVMLAFLAFVRGEQQSSIGWKLASLTGFVVALLAKESAVALPALIVVYVGVFTTGTLAQRIKRAILASAPFIAITVAYLYVHQLLTRSVVGNQAHVSLQTALLTIPSLVVFYLTKLVAPVGLSAYYDNPYVTTVNSAGFLFPVLLIAVVTVATFFWQRKSAESRLIRFAACWFVLTLGPALVVCKLPADGIASDRYLYTASTAFCLLAALALDQAIEKLVPAAIRRWTLPAAIAGIAAVLAAMNVAQQVFWANDFLLYKRGVEIAPGNDRARNNYGRVLVERGDISAAEAIFIDLLKRAPDSAVAHYNLGYTYYREGRYPEAEPHLVQAVAGEPTNPFMHLYLGMVALHESNLDVAEREVGQAVRMRPGNLGFHLALSYVLEKKGDMAGALEETRTELAHNPANEMIRLRAKQLELKASRIKPVAKPAPAPTR